MNDARKVFGICCLCVALVVSGCNKPASRPASNPAPTAAPPPTGEPSAVKAATKEVPLPPDLIQFKAEVSKATAQIDMVVGTMDALANSTGNLKEPYGKFTAALKALETETQAVKKRADDMREKGATYFEAWEKSVASMTTPEVKEVATKRKSELTKKYTDVLTNVQETRAAHDSFATGLQSIQKTLDDELTPEGLRKTAPLMTKAKEGAKTVKDRAAATLQKLGEIGGIYSQP